MEENQQTYINPDGKKYTVIDVLGKGQYGKVLKVIDENKNIYALKEQEYIRPVEKEFIDKIKSGGDGLLKIFEYLQQQEKFYIVQEYCNQGNLENYLKKKGLLDIKEAQKILLQISKQLSIIHQMGYIYQDLKPENIVIKEINNKLKYYLCDFGSIININNNNEDRQLTQSRLGTPYYIAPESMDLTNELDETIDIWALGVIYYELVTGKKLFDGDHKQQIFRQIKSEKQDELNQKLITVLKVDKQKDQILLSMFNTNSKKRPNAEQVKNYLIIQQKKQFKPQIKKLQNEFREKDDQCIKLVQENEKLTEEIKQLTANSEKQQKLIQTQNTQLTQISQNLINILSTYKQEQFTESQIKLNSEELKFDELKQNFGIIEIQLTVIKKLLDQYSNSIKQLTEDKFILQKKFNEETIQIQQLESNNMELQSKIKQEEQNSALLSQQKNQICQELENIKLELKNQKEYFFNQIDSRILEEKLKLSSKISQYFDAIDQQFIDLELAKILILDLVKIPTYPINIVLSNDKNNSLKFIQQIENNSKIDGNLMQSIDLKQNFYFADDFNFEAIDEREKQIADLQDLFRKFPNKIGGIFIVTKFERNDIMKRSIMLIYKYFQKFQNLISIVVTDFHLSDSPKEDKEMLIKLFACFQPKNIVFIGERLEILKNDLAKSFSPLNKQEFYPFDTKDTILELIDPEEQNKIMQDLIKQLPKQVLKNPK